MSDWVKLWDTHRKELEQDKPPEGYVLSHEIAALWGIGVWVARRRLNLLTEAGAVERIRFKNRWAYRMKNEP